MSQLQPFARVCGLYPCTGGFAFAVLEVRGRVLDWGKIDLGSDADGEFEARLVDHLRRYEPAALALESDDNPRRSSRARRRIKLAAIVARRRRLRCLQMSRESVARALSLPAGSTKQSIVEALCLRHPELVPRMPSRAIWKRDPRMHVFVALGLAWAIVDRLRRLRR